MVENNTFFVDLFAPLKPGYITFHIEEEKNPHRLVQYIRELGIKPGIVLNPHTPAESVEYLLQDLDMVLVMSVNPGFGGQKFIPSTLDKVRAVKQRVLEGGYDIRIEIDGGVKVDNIREIAEAGADMFVAGSAIFSQPDYSDVIKQMRNELASLSKA